MTESRKILLISCYELGHQPAGVSIPMGFLKHAGFEPITLDLSIEPFDANKVKDAWFVGISVPMHTALRLGVQVARQVRSLSPDSYICFYGLYALLNSDFLLNGVADFVLAGEV